MNIDFIAILGNLSLALDPLQRLISGLAYLLGMIFFIIAILKLKKVAGTTRYSSSHEKMYAPVIYLLMSSALLFLPTALIYLSNTVFGSGNVLNYAPLQRTNIYSIMDTLIRTAGLLWFIRGCVLLTHASQPGAKAGSKGMVFLVAGILAINFTNTMSMLNTILLYLFKLTAGVKPS